MFCQATGYGGTPKTEDVARPKVADGEVTVKFDANVNSALPWRFHPEKRQVRLRLGEETLVHFTAANLSDQPVTGTATFNVVPEKVAPYFSKLECFCFTEQTLAPGQEVSMPVVFFVDPALAEDATARDATRSPCLIRSSAPKVTAGRRRTARKIGRDASRRARAASGRNKTQQRERRNGEPSSTQGPSLPHGRSQPVAGARHHRRADPGDRRHLVHARRAALGIACRLRHPSRDLLSLVARRRPRVAGRSLPHGSGQSRPAGRLPAVHRLGGDVLLRLLLGVLQRQRAGDQPRRA